ncbi:rhodanese-like domain-containing protein [bacterium]|nr:rhodanese-like domain-containing protein [bacterium]
MSLFGLINPNKGIQQITADQLRKRMAQDKLVIIDVREPSEHAERNIPGSILIPLGALPSRLNELQKFKDQEIIVYCRSGNRSAHACRHLIGNGFKAVNLSGGILGWN